MDYWLYSKLNRKIADATEAMERLELRDAAVAVLYDLWLNSGGTSPGEGPTHSREGVPVLAWR